LINPLGNVIILTKLLSAIEISVMGHNSLSDYKIGKLIYAGIKLKYLNLLTHSSGSGTTSPPSIFAPPHIVSSTAINAEILPYEIPFME
jgi:hypothetical protein